MSTNASMKQIEKYIKKTIEKRISQYPAWPTNIFQLELEGAGIYQNKSGKFLAELIDDGYLSKSYENSIPYIHDPSANLSLDGTDVKEATEEFYDYRDDPDQASFLELTLYVAIAKECSLLNGDFIQIYPKGDYTHILRGMPDEIDGLLKLNHEWFGLQVYSGIQFLTMTDQNGKRDKVKQAEKVSNNKDPQSNPVIISPLASEDVRNHIRKPHDGTVLDLRKLVACEDNQGQLNEALDFLNIKNRVEFIPKLSTCYSKLNLDGEQYNKLVKKVPSAITPEKVAQGATDLPDRYRQRIRGMIHLLYVNTFWRRADDRKEREASVVLQQAFHHLLRSDGMEIDKYIRVGWKEFDSKFTKVKSKQQREPAIKQKARDYVSILVNQNVMTRRKTKIYARNSKHPHSSLKFPSGFYS